MRADHGGLAIFDRERGEAAFGQLQPLILSTPLDGVFDFGIVSVHVL